MIKVNLNFTIIDFVFEYVASICRYNSIRQEHILNLDLAKIDCLLRIIWALELEFNQSKANGNAQRDNLCYLGEKIDNHYVELASLLPEGAIEDDDLMLLIVSPFQHCATDPVRANISLAVLLKWVADFKNEKNRTLSLIAELKLYLYFTCDILLDRFLDAYDFFSAPNEQMKQNILNN